MRDWREYERRETDALIRICVGNGGVLLPSYMVINIPALGFTGEPVARHAWGNFVPLVLLILTEMHSFPQ